MESNESDLSSEGSDFIATEEMLKLAYDDESTINDEEAMADDDEDEINKLKLESDMPIEELLRLYGSQAEVELKENIELESNSVSGIKIPLNSETVHNKSDCSNEPCNTVQNINNEIENEAPRGSSRLWCKALIENNSNYNSEDDGDYIPIIDSKLFANAKIRIGENYQAFIPGFAYALCHNDFCLQLRCNEILLWKCLDNSDNFQSVLKQYLKRYGEVSGQTGLINGKIDDPTALYTLMEQDYDSDAAIAYLKNKPIRSSNLPTIMQSWSEQECTEFEKGFEIHNKNFRIIKEQRLRTRSVAELVEFYYFWKKTARYDEFIRWCKRDKKKPLNQITDFIDCLTPSEPNGRKENYLLGNWPGVKVGNEILNVSEEDQRAIFLNKLLMCNGSEHEHVKNGTWNMTTSSLTVHQKECQSLIDTNSDNSSKEPLVKTSILSGAPTTSPGETSSSSTNTDK